MIALRVCSVMSPVVGGWGSGSRWSADFIGGNGPLSMSRNKGTGRVVKKYTKMQMWGGLVSGRLLTQQQVRMREANNLHAFIYELAFLSPAATLLGNTSCKWHKLRIVWFYSAFIFLTITDGRGCTSAPPLGVGSGKSLCIPPSLVFFLLILSSHGFSIRFEGVVF